MPRKRVTCTDRKEKELVEHTARNALLLEHVKALFPEAEARMEEVEKEGQMAQFLHFACRVCLRYDPRSTVHTPRLLSTYLSIIGKHLRTVVRSKEFISQLVNRFIRSTRKIQRFYKAHLKDRSEIFSRLVMRWRAVETNARHRIRDEIIARQAVVLTADRQLNTLHLLFHDCWIPNSEKLEAIRHKWQTCIEAFGERFRRWKAASKKVVQTAVVEDSLWTNLDFLASHPGSLDKIEFKKPKKQVHVRIANEIAAPRMVDIFQWKTIQVRELVQCLGNLYARKLKGYVEKLHGPRNNRTAVTNKWVSFYNELLAFGPDNMEEVVGMYWSHSRHVKEHLHTSRKIRSGRMVNEWYVKTHLSNFFHVPPPAAETDTPALSDVSEEAYICSASRVGVRTPTPTPPPSEMHGVKHYQTILSPRMKAPPRPPSRQRRVKRRPSYQPWVFQSPQHRRQHDAGTNTLDAASTYASTPLPPSQPTTPRTSIASPTPRKRTPRASSVSPSPSRFSPTPPKARAPSLSLQHRPLTPVGRQDRVHQIPLRPSSALKFYTTRPGHRLVPSRDPTLDIQGFS
eukprot:Sspe_Gene.62684::Locus_35368_Transcript_1_1_Confidence_1.000_Length_1934::g.62684::m.62684